MLQAEKASAKALRQENDGQQDAGGWNGMSDVESSI